MTESEFNAQMNRLTAQFGKSFYTTERQVLIWDAVGTLDGFTFRRIVDKLIGECRQAPLVPEIREHVARERERLWSSTKRDPMQYPTGRGVLCPQCKDSGALLALPKDGKSGPYAFKCLCDSGLSDGRKFPSWPPRDADDFEVCR